MAKMMIEPSAVFRAKVRQILPSWRMAYGMCPAVRRRARVRERSDRSTPTKENAPSFRRSHTLDHQLVWAGVDN